METTNKLPLLSVCDNTHAPLDEAVVCQHQKVSQSRTACSSISQGRYQELDRSIVSYSTNEVLVFNMQTSCMLQTQSPQSIHTYSGIISVTVVPQQAANQAPRLLKASNQLCILIADVLCRMPISAC